MNILYSTGCPKCKILKDKLNKKGVAYAEVNDVELMKGKGFDSVPILEVDGRILDFKEANDWINQGGRSV